MIKINANINPIVPNGNLGRIGPGGAKGTGPSSAFSDTINTVSKEISKVDDLQQGSDMSIKDLLSGRNEDITSVVSAVAKADMSFKLLVGVRNKLVEAYKQTMNMPL